MTTAGSPATTPRETMIDVWERHVAAEFGYRDVEAALATMTEDAHVLNVPLLSGGVGKAQVREFYAGPFLPQIPADLEPISISRTVGDDRLIEEAVYRFTHNSKMDWILPGMAPTGRRIEVAVVAIIHFRDGLIASEHLYWDHASVLAQAGCLDTLPIAGAESCRKLLAVSGIGAGGA